ncbi:DUF7344 domain-containing protein [Haladaptatus salinisoli]|uniref:DUF7344 domain-containing protein n=1 Tax=Haladaptatus salinisoli TaxID=2884876 RepID=UPI001D0BD131|nr:hypothetical protein [Haladaptatus salinisoli]
MSGDSIEVGAVFEACGDQHRRIVLAVLADQQRSITLSELTKMIVKRNHHMPLSEASDEELTQIKSSLYHCHLPKLADANLISFDMNRKLVALHEDTETINQETLFDK